MAILLMLLILTSTLVGAVSVSPDRAGLLADLELLLQWGDRASGSPNEKSAAKLIGDRFRELGLQVETQSFTVRGIQSQNVIGIKPGSDPHAGIITVTAHYDSARAGVPGANDNASGTVVMLELARLWAERVTSSTLQFIAFGAEEHGMLGAQHYLTTPQAENVALNLNLDMVGKGGKISLDRAPVWLIRAIAQSARQHGYPFVLHYATLAAMRSDGSPTDSRPFADRGIPTVSLTSAEGMEDHNYHSPADNLANVNGEDLLRAAVVVNDLLARYDGQQVPWGERHFAALTILGRLVIVPGWVSYTTVVAAALLWFGLWWSRRRREERLWPAVKRGLGILGSWAVVAAAVEVVSGNGYPWPYLIAVLVATLLHWLIGNRSRGTKSMGSADGLSLIGIPVALMLLCAALTAWDYALMIALVLIPATATAISDYRWCRLAWWIVALVPFLYLSASNWLPRAETLFFILEIAYIPTLGLMTAQLVRSWAKPDRP